MTCPICRGPTTLDYSHPEAELYRCSQCTHRFSQIKPEIPMEPYDPAYFEQTHRNWFAHPQLDLFTKIAELIEREPLPRSVIDVGCGNGNFLRFLAARWGTTVALTGVDLMVNEPSPGIEFIQGDIHSVDIHRQFSVVVSLATIEHLADAHAFARRLKSLTRPGGIAIVMTLNDNSLLYAAARLLRGVGATLAFDRLYSRHHIHHFTCASLARLLESEGLRPEATILHNAPLASIDIPASSAAAALVLRGGVGLLFALGSFSRRTYLQTIVCRRDAIDTASQDDRTGPAIGTCQTRHYNPSSTQ